MGEKRVDYERRSQQKGRLRAFCEAHARYSLTAHPVPERIGHGDLLRVQRQWVRMGI